MSDKGKTRLKMIAGSVVVVLILGILVIGRMGGLKKTIKAIMQVPPTLVCDSDIVITGAGHATIPPIFTGEAISIEGTVYNAAPTSNREKLVILEEDGSLYVTDFSLSEKTVIAENGNSILLVRDEGFLYRDSKNKLYRYLFADGSVLDLGKFEDYMVSEEDFTVSFADAKGKVYVLTADSVEKKEIGDYSGVVDIVWVSDDGNMVVYGSNVKEAETVWFYCDGTLTQLWELVGLNSINSSVLVRSFEEEAGTSIAIIPFVWTGNSVYVKPAGGELTEIEFGDYARSNSFYNEQGLYVGTDTTDQMVRWIDPYTGATETVQDFVKQYEIIDNRMYYVDKLDGSLYRATISKSTLSDQEKIDEDVAYFVCSTDGQNVYYIKESQEKEFCYNLYAAEEGKAPALVDELVTYDYDIGFVLLDDTGKTIYYFTNEKEVRVEGYTLKKYTMGEEKSMLIDSYVETKSLTSGREDGRIENNSFIYQCFPKANNFDSKYNEWRYFNGTKSETFLDGLGNVNVTDEFEENKFIPSWR